MQYEFSAISESEIPRATVPLLQHAIDTYTSEINKVYATWARFSEAQMDFRPHPKSMTVRDVMKHELLSQRRFFSEFLSSPEPPASEVLSAAQYKETAGRVSSAATGVFGGSERGLVASEGAVF